MVFDSRMYSRDPMLIAIENEEHQRRKTCAGCAHKITLHLMGRDMQRCTKWNIAAAKKCRSYKA